MVGIGASAGGLEALRSFFQSLPSDTGLGFVVVIHLDPDHKSLMADLLTRCTAMPVDTAEEGMAVEPNRVYVIPPSRHLRIEAGTLRLVDLNGKPGPRVPVDRFLRSLAEDLQERAIAIILSGSGSDGTLGAKAVKEHGGMVIAQEPEEASYGSMPRSAIGAGAVDHILAIRDVPKVLTEYARQPYVALGGTVADNGDEWNADLQKILVLLKARTPLDFEPYKKGTLERRIARRMGLNHVTSRREYLELLRASPDEVSFLSRELLIGVTGFYRDPEAFAYLSGEAFNYPQFWLR